MQKLENLNGSLHIRQRVSDELIMKTTEHEVKHPRIGWAPHYQDP